jgi:hypothetical protein
MIVFYTFTMMYTCSLLECAAAKRDKGSRVMEIGTRKKITIDFTDLSVVVIHRILLSMIAKSTMQDFDSVIEEALVDGAKQMKTILRDDDALPKDKTAAFNALVGASGLKTQRQAELQPSRTQQNQLDSQTMESLIGAVGGLMAMVGQTIDKQIIKSVAEQAMQAGTVTDEMEEAPPLAVTIQLPAPAQPSGPLPGYMNTLSTPRSIEVKRAKNG